MLTQREKTFPVLGLWEGRKQAKYQTKLFTKKEMFLKTKKKEILHGFHGSRMKEDVLKR